MGRLTLATRALRPGGGVGGIVLDPNRGLQRAGQRASTADCLDWYRNALQECHRSREFGLTELGHDGTEGLNRWCTSDTRWSTPECQGSLRAALISVFHNAWSIAANKKTEDRQQGALLPASDPGGITRPHPGLRPGLPTGAFQVDCTVAGTSRRRAWRRRSQRQTPTAGSISRAEEGSGDMTDCSSSLASEMSPPVPTVPCTSNQNSAGRLAGM